MKETAKLLDAWQPPEGMGSPVAVLATSFTFDPDFFEEDCLGRFLALDGQYGEGDRISDTAALIDREERLAEVRVSVLVDRSHGEQGRSLRWDVLSVPVRGGLLHAKVSLLVWERLVRLIVSSANLTAAGYRRQLETAACFDACVGSEVPGFVLEAGIDALRAIALRIPAREGSPPKARALATLADALRRVQRLELPGRLQDGLKCDVSLTAPGASALAALDRVWNGARPNRATVVSPFFDTDERRNEPAAALAQKLNRHGEGHLQFVVPVERPTLNSTTVRAPASIRAAVPDRVEVAVHAYQTPDKEDPRGLHAKIVSLSSPDWVAVLVGSSNFTSAGLGVSGVGHLEINVAFGAPAGSKAGRALEGLFDRYIGAALDLEKVVWEPLVDDEEPVVPPLPLGFQECLFHPDEPARMELGLQAGDLPPSWAIRLPNGDLLLDSSSWQAAGCPATVVRPVPALAEVYMVLVTWAHHEVEVRTSWPVNVTDPGLLPPVQELRSLTARALLLALASIRPFPQALAEEIERSATVAGTSVELDPLRRYSDIGHLMTRIRAYSQGLSGLRRRLTRPAYSIDSLIWRLRGPVGPLAIARKWIEDHGDGRALKGETDFLLAELVLTLRSVDWRETALGIPRAKVDEVVSATMKDITKLRLAETTDPRLETYVETVFGGHTR